MEGAAVPEALRQRWRAGAVDLAERREIIAMVVTTCVVRPGVKGKHTWDAFRLEPVWRSADRAGWAEEVD